MRCGHPANLLPRLAEPPGVLYNASKRDGASARSCQLATGTRLPMDAYTARGEGQALTHRQALLIVLGLLLPTFMGSLDQTILATAVPPIGRAFEYLHGLPGR